MRGEARIYRAWRCRRGQLHNQVEGPDEKHMLPGLRIREVLGLNWSHVDLVEGKLSLTPLQTKDRSNKRSQAPALCPRLLRVLARLAVCSFPFESEPLCELHMPSLIRPHRRVPVPCSVT